MDRDEIDTLARSWIFAVASGNADALGELLTEDVVDRSGPTPSVGRETFQTRAMAVATAFGEIEIAIEDMIVEGNSGAWRWVLSGTHVGPFAGIAPTNRRITFRGVNFQRFAGGRVSEHFTLVDIASIMKQLSP